MVWQISFVLLGHYLSNNIMQFVAIFSLSVAKIQGFWQFFSTFVDKLLRFAETANPTVAASSEK